MNFFILLLTMLLSWQSGFLQAQEGQNSIINSLGNSSADLIIFSFDRPMQLYAYLESVEKYIKNLGTVFILARSSSDDFDAGYKVVQEAFPSVKFFFQTRKSSGDFKALLLNICFQQSLSDYVVFGVDDIIVTDYFDIHDCLRALNETNSYGFYLRAGKNITGNYWLGRDKILSHPPFNEVKPGILQWRFNQGVVYSLWCYPNSVDMTIFKKSVIKNTVETIDYTAPNNFEYAWKMVADLSKTGLCFAHSVMINIPLNIVQDVYNWNFNMGLLTPVELLAIFNKGLKIDINQFYKLDNITPHEDHMPTFIQRSSRNCIIEKPIVIVSTSRNAKEYYQSNIDSILHQEYKNYRIIWIDDASDDGSAELVENYLSIHDTAKKVLFIKNKERFGAMANQYSAIYNLCKNNEIVVVVDGDDALIDTKVLSVLNKEYTDNDIWMTYGNYKPLVNKGTHSSFQIPYEIIKNNAFRSQNPYTAGQLRTFYAWLFKRIKREDLQINGTFYPVLCDHATMLPMLEMAGERSKFIDKALLLYNNNSPDNDSKKNRDFILQYYFYIRSLKPYDRLDSMPSELNYDDATKAYQLRKNKHPLYPTKEWNNILSDKSKDIINNALMKKNILNKTIDPATIAVVVLSTENRKELANITLKRIEKYCATWGYSYHLYQEPLDTSRVEEWNKILAVKKTMQLNSKYEWIVWIDDDILLTNPLIRLEDFIDSYGQNKELIISQDIGGWVCFLLNTGIFFIRNTDTMKKLLDDVWEMGQIKNYLQRGRTYLEQASLIDCIQEKPQYRDYIESLPLGVLQGFIRPEAQISEKSRWNPYVFASHACGMKYEARIKKLNTIISQGEIPQYI